MAAAAAESEFLPDANQSDLQDVNLVDDNEEDEDSFGPSAPKPGVYQNIFEVIFLFGVYGVFFYVNTLQYDSVI